QIITNTGIDHLQPYRLALLQIYPIIIIFINSAGKAFLTGVSTGASRGSKPMHQRVVTDYLGIVWIAIAFIVSKQVVNVAIDTDARGNTKPAADVELAGRGIRLFRHFNKPTTATAGGQPQAAQQHNNRSDVRSDRHG